MKNRVFNSITEMRRFIDNTPLYHGNRKGSEQASERFTHTATMEEADKLAEAGWPEAVKRMMAAGIDTPKPYGTRTRQTFAPVGYAPSVGRYLQGHPANMIRNAKTPQKAHKIINIYYNICVLAEVDTAQMITAGIKILEAVRDLEESGYRCNIYAAAANGYGEGWQTAVKVKTDGEALNLSRVSYALAHPSFLRRHIFAVWERERKLPFGYGDVGKYHAENAIIINAADFIDNPDGMQNVVKLQLREITK